jgi:hypothetical protein
MLLLLTVLAGGILGASPALASPKGPKPAPPAKPIPPPDWIAATLASVSVTGPPCTDPVLSQPFTAWDDSASYTLAPGQSPFNFTGSQWLLLDGASLVRTTLADGRGGQVLDLPSRSLAVSPPMCVDSNYPTAKTMIRSVSGGGGVGVFVTYADASSWGKARNGGAVHGDGPDWGLSDRINLQPSHAPGWQLVRFALVAPNHPNAEFQLYNFYVDPYAKR